MGLTVHFRLPVLDRIEEACCSRDQRRAAEPGAEPLCRGNVATMGTGELNSTTRSQARAGYLWRSLWAASSASPSLPSWPSRSSWKAPARDLPSSAAWAGNGRVFYIRCAACVDAEERKKELMAQRNEMNGLMFKMEDDPASPRWGASSKDQHRRTAAVFDVLRGSMSLVGTRPPLDSTTSMRATTSAAFL